MCSTYHGSKEEVFAGEGAEEARVGLSQTVDVEETENHT